MAISVQLICRRGGRYLVGIMSPAFTIKLDAKFLCYTLVNGSLSTAGALFIETFPARRDEA